jgi:hypothetical protein
MKDMVVLFIVSLAKDRLALNDRRRQDISRHNPREPRAHAPRRSSGPERSAAGPGRHPARHGCRIRPPGGDLRLPCAHRHPRGDLVRRNAQPARGAGTVGGRRRRLGLGRGLVQLSRLRRRAPGTAPGHGADAASAGNTCFERPGDHPRAGGRPSDPGGPDRGMGPAGPGAGRHGHRALGSGGPPRRPATGTAARQHEPHEAGPCLCQRHQPRRRAADP